MPTKSELEERIASLEEENRDLRGRIVSLQIQHDEKEALISMYRQMYERGLLEELNGD